MQCRYVTLLRAISNVAMQPFREAMEELGFTDVQSYGMSGNLLFNAADADTVSLEKTIAARFGTDAFVRTHAEMAQIVASDPFREEDGASMLFLAHPPDEGQQRAFMDLDFDTTPPVVQGKTVFFVWPLRLRDRRTPLDIEKTLDIPGTARSARVVARILAHMTEPST